jgi:AMP-polyphosphate phosphotransferase
MFRTVELGRKFTKEQYKAQLPELRAELLQMQFALSKTKRPVIILITGVDGAGRGDVVNALNEWLDPRGLETISFERLTDEERERPEFWRYWRRLPERGRIGVFFGGWYVDPIREFAYGESRQADLDDALAINQRFESMLVADGAIILKFWLHLSKEDQLKRLKRMEKDPNSMRRVSERDWKHVDLYGEFLQAAERTIRLTDTGDAPWYLIESKDKRYRDLTIGQTLLDVLRKHLVQLPVEKNIALPPPETEQKLIAKTDLLPSDVDLSKARLTILDQVDFNLHISERDYRKQLEIWQARLNRLAWAAHEKKISSVVVFEGPDAAGKGGAIRRITQALDARLYHVISTAAPTDEERAHHYLWRFWRHIPHAGTFTLYDRSWYGRVLVERVEKFASEIEWRRAYWEINDFEEMLVNHGTLVAKYWVHISKEEQLNRFKEREQIAYKRHKITDEDWRNREKWNDYAHAVNDMIARTSTNYAPWTLISGNDKRFARIEILKTLCHALEKMLE